MTPPATDDKIGLTWDTMRRFLKDHGHPWELILHPEDFRRVRMLVGDGPIKSDEHGPYVWFEVTRCRPPKGSNISLNLARQEFFTEAKMGWRKDSGWK